MENLVHYSNPLHALSMLGTLNEQRLQGQMCDVVLVVADQRYQAHRSVLAASSEYFQTLFTRMDAETLKIVNLDFCEPDAFEIVLNYIYSSSLFVDKGSLAAIQELGYSLGIPFLTNIASTKAHASYCVSRKRLSFSDGDENDVQTRSVIMCRVNNDTTHPSCSNYQRKPEIPLSPHSTWDSAHPPSANSLHEFSKNSESIGRKPSEASAAADKKSTFPYATVLKGNLSSMTSVRPLLTSSVSFSDAEVQHNRLQAGTGIDTKDENEEQVPYYRTEMGQVSVPSKAIDRSGPLIKSLLRRSLSMDSPVPVFSPTLELKELQNHEQSVVKTASKAVGPEVPAQKCNPKRTSPLVIRSEYLAKYDEETGVERDGSVKDEPSSPLADPMDIIRITVGDSLPVSLKDLQTNCDQGSRPDFSYFGKRRDRPDNRRYPFKKSKIFKEQHSLLFEGEKNAASRNTTGDFNRDIEESSQSKMFKCWNCLKMFRSSAGLHRHVNMYHNPEKPYACDICHKRFHTNFKVWTHCQTQHGVIQNPASSSSSSVLDDKFQKKLIDIVREREIKKALLWKLKRNKHSLQSPVLNKKRLKPSFICPYCGKVFVFQSKYRQHLRTHSAEKGDQDIASDRKELDGVIQKAETPISTFSCRLCNMKLSSLFELGDHERGCRHATVCPYCGLCFSNPAIKKDHEAHCKYKKLTCLECMRSFKSSFSIWRHQVEVHNQNMMTVKDQLELKQQENEEKVEELREDHSHDKHLESERSREAVSYSDSSAPPMYDSEDSSSYVPEDLSVGHYTKLVVKEEPFEEAVSQRDHSDTAKPAPEEPGVWPCEKCGNLFGCRKDLERHQELLCHIKPFICHICNKAFRTNFRLWSHFQSHMSSAMDPGVKDIDRQFPPQSPSPPLTLPTLQHSSSQSSTLKSTQAPLAAAAVVSEDHSSPEPCSSSVSKTKQSEVDLQPGSRSPLMRSNSVENQGGSQESDTLFYHAPSLSVLTFKRQYMCKLCHRTFKTAFSLWSHEQSHSHT